MRLRYKPNAIDKLKENPLMIFEAEKFKGKWKEVFKNENPIELEIGSGKGDFVKQMALENPDKNYLALDTAIKALVLASRKFDKDDTPNIRAIIGDAEDIVDMFDKDEISKIYLNFSTPWPKRKHHKRRLSHKVFLDRYKKIVKKGAILELKTDNREFFDDTLKYLEENDLEILKKNYDISVEESKVLTEYERKWRRKSIPICFVRARFR
ncbi:MAG: tRNA (guanosine(46)-N7)-methyltransferase TrmB [Anaerococcus sp.]